VVHPIVYSHLTKGWFNSIKKQWKKKFKVPINITENNNLNFIDVKFYNQEMEEIKI
jgi:ribonuclease G